MRVGDFSVEVVAADGGAREIESGHVLARPGQVYSLRLRNHGPLRAVAEITIDGHSVTEHGLVIDALSTVYLERPIHETERGRFTVIAEGDERVFGPDGGRDNPNLGLIEARFRRELPEPKREWPVEPSYPTSVPRPISDGSPGAPAPGPWRPGMPRFTPPTWNAESAPITKSAHGGFRGAINALLAASTSIFEREPAPPPDTFFARSMDYGAALDDGVALDHLGAAIERAAGTGLTGSSRQEFQPVYVGKLEPEATVIRLRLVIGSEEALSAPRRLPESNDVPARPAARP